MKKLFKRFVAYMIDMMVVLLIVQCLSGIPQINKQLDDYNKYYDDYVDLYKNYAAFKLDLNEYFEDETLTEEEYNNLVQEHESYVDTLNNYYKNGELTTKNYEKLNTKVDGDYEKQYKEVYYKIEKNATFYLVIYLIVVIAYFVGFNKYTNGQTLGKKLMRLRIVNSKDSSSDVPIWSYIVRALVLYQLIYYITRLIGINFMNAGMYYNVTGIVYKVQSYLEMLIIAMAMIRIDGRGPQDLLAKTRVALYDRNGNEVEDKFDIVSKRIEELKNSNKKVVDEEIIDEEENTSKELADKKENKTKIRSKKRVKKVIDEEPTE